MIYQALKTWFQTYGVLLKLLMIDMCYEVMRKHRYGYLEEIVVENSDNVLYRFTKGNVHLRSLLFEKRVKDLQLGVESYQKKINVTKPDTTRPDLRKRHPYTPYKDPQGFIYVDDYKRNRVLAEEKMEHIGKEKISFHDQGHQQAAKGKEDDEEFGEICWRFDTSAGNPVKEILLKLNLPDHRSILTDSKIFYKVSSYKTTNGNKPVKQISVTKKPERQIPTGHRFSIKTTYVVYDKIKTPRSCLRWKPMGRILKTIGLRWVPTRKIFTSSITTIDSEPPHGSNTDITNLHECIQTLDSSARISINIQEEYSFDLSAGTHFNQKKERIKAWIKENSEDRF
ncbi:hypothetical protein Tco_0213437 [Tanacetum coccineum]